MVITLKHKLIISSLCMLLLVGTISSVSYNMDKGLAEKQDQGASLYNIASEAVDASAIGASLYQIVADAVINRNLEQTEKDWKTEKEESLKKIADLAASVTSPEDKKLIDEASRSLDVFIGLFEQQTLPELKRLGSLELSPSIREIDDKMDKSVSASQEALKKLSENQMNSAKKGDEEFDILSHNSMTITIVLLIVGCSIAVANAIYLIYQISHPITAMTSSMKSLSDGDTSKEIPCINRSDEIGNMAKAVLVFKENMIKNNELTAQQEEQKKYAEKEKKIMMHKLADDFESAVSSAVSSVAAAATELSQTSMDMRNIASKTNEQVLGVASASNQTSGTVQTVAAAAEEMSASIKEISSQISKSSSIVRDVLEETRSANSISTQMLEASRSISTVTEFIESIASQINLLALNATIESARAGESGKGFAVVASEVKHLAGQTSKATDEIRQQLDNLGKMAENVAGALVKLGGSVEKVNESSSSIASAVEEQTAVTQEIATNMNSTASSVDQINNNISGIKKSTESTSAATQQILSASDMLSKQAEDLSLKVQTFLGNIRAA